MRAIRVLSPDSNEMEFIRNPFGEDGASQGHSTQSGSATEGPTSAELGHIKSGSDLTESDTSSPFFRMRDVVPLEATERGVALIFPRVVFHRVHVRKPSEEVLSSALFGSVRESLADVVDNKYTIKSLLVEIMKDV